jgi:hypothetical protein
MIPSPLASSFPILGADEGGGFCRVLSGLLSSAMALPQARRRTAQFKQLSALIEQDRNHATAMPLHGCIVGCNDPISTNLADPSPAKVWLGPSAQRQPRSKKDQRSAVLLWSPVICVTDDKKLAVEWRLDTSRHGPQDRKAGHARDRGVQIGQHNKDRRTKTRGLGEEVGEIRAAARPYLIVHKIAPG